MSPESISPGHSQGTLRLSAARGPELSALDVATTPSDKAGTVRPWSSKRASVVAVVVFGLLLFPAMFWLRFTHVRYFYWSPPEPLDGLSRLVELLACFLLSVFVHESGHAIAGARAGFRLQSLFVGPLLIRRGDELGGSASLSISFHLLDSGDAALAREALQQAIDRLHVGADRLTTGPQATLALIAALFEAVWRGDGDAADRWITSTVERLTSER